MEVFFKFTRFNIKDIDQNLENKIILKMILKTFFLNHLNIPENIVSLWSKIVLHESLLSTTIPQVQYKIPKQSDKMFYHVPDYLQLICSLT